MKYRAWLGVMILFAAVQTCDARADQGAPFLQIRNVGLDRKVFGPDQGQKVVINFTLTAPADVRVTIYDLLGSAVWSHEVSLPGGPASVEWSGTCEDGHPAAGNIFLYTIRASDGRSTVTYNPATETGGTFVSNTVFTYEKETGKMEYVLPNTCMVQIRVTLRSMMLVSTVLRWQPQTAGRHQMQLPDKDESGLIAMAKNQEIDILLTAYTMPDNAIVRGGKSIALSDDEVFVTGKDDPWMRKDRCVYYRQDPRFINEPRFKVSFFDEQQHPLDTTALVSRPSHVRITLDERDRPWLTDRKCEVIFYIDGVYFFDLEDATTPFTCDLDPKLLANGPHVLTINVAGYGNRNVGVMSRRLVIGD